ncbi:hypothetical protein BH11MYX2_BH11MYX2_19090 [soil metagenome]
MAVRIPRIKRGSRGIIEHLLEHLAAPAFVVDQTGKLLEANTSGKELFGTDPREITRRLAAAVNGENVHFTTSSIAGASLFVAVAQIAHDTRVSHAITNAAAHWTLTPRQREVLDRVVRGAATTAIAEELRISTRAVELHVTRLFDRAGTDNYPALVAAVLAGVR